MYTLLNILTERQFIPSESLLNIVYPVIGEVSMSQHHLVLMQGEQGFFQDKATISDTCLKEGMEKENNLESKIGKGNISDGFKMHRG